MSHTLILNPSIIRPLVFGWKLNSKTVWFSGFALIVSLMGFYVFQICYVTQASFTIANYEKQINNLDREFKNLQINFSGTNSLSGLEKLLVAEGYEKVDKIHYIQVLDGSVASK